MVGLGHKDACVLPLHLPADVDLQAGVRRVWPRHRPPQVLLKSIFYDLLYLSYLVTFIQENIYVPRFRSRSYLVNLYVEKRKYIFDKRILVRQFSLPAWVEEVLCWRLCHGIIGGEDSRVGILKSIQVGAQVLTAVTAWRWWELATRKVFSHRLKSFWMLAGLSAYSLSSLMGQCTPSDTSSSVWPPFFPSWDLPLLSSY